MFIKQFFVPGLSHLSYMVGAGKQCVVIDPSRDPDVYLDAAREMGFQIKYILETHLHADFISGHLDLAGMTGAEIILPSTVTAGFPHMPAGEGFSLEVEHLRFEVMETFGHTPEHISYLTYDTSRGSSPVAVFTGDTLFVGDVGRPDLFPSLAVRLAGQLFESIKKLMSLPDFVEVYPAHSAGSLCGKAISAKRSSTIGYERKHNRAIQPMSLEDFKRSLLQDMPEAPDHFSRCSMANAAGPPLLSSIPPPAQYPPEEFRKVMESGAMVLDVRNAESFAGLHIPGSLSIGIDGNFPTFAGWFIPPGTEVVLVAGCRGDHERAEAALRRVGIDRIAAVLEGGVSSWAARGFPVASIPQVSVHSAVEMCGTAGGTLLDVRSRGEYNAYHLEKAVNIPVHDIRHRHGEIMSQPVACICSSGHRSIMAASMLKSRGFEDVLNIPGGMTAWSGAGLGRSCGYYSNVHGPGAEQG